jgi:hypothetical protein
MINLKYILISTLLLTVQSSYAVEIDNVNTDFSSEKIIVNLHHMIGFNTEGHQYNLKISHCAPVLPIQCFGFIDHVEPPEGDGWTNMGFMKATVEFDMKSSPYAKELMSKNSTLTIAGSRNTQARSQPMLVLGQVKMAVSISDLPELPLGYEWENIGHNDIGDRVQNIYQLVIKK